MARSSSALAAIQHTAAASLPAARALEAAGLAPVFTRRQARAAGLTDRHLQALCRHGALTRRAVGLYERTSPPDVPAAEWGDADSRGCRVPAKGMSEGIPASDPSDPDLLGLAARSPRATLCLRTALAYHGLIDDIPERVDVALPRGSRAPVVDSPIRWHYFAPDTFDLARETLHLAGGATVGIYSAERCIVDAFRLAGQEGPELARSALRAWLRRPGSQPAALLSLARQLPRARTPLQQALEILL